MKYVKQHFVTGMKVSLPDVLNRMEDGIAAACAAAVEGKLCLTLPRGDPGPQGDPGEGLSDNAKALLLSLLAGTALDRDAALAALRAEWGLAEPDDTTPEAADAADAADAAEEA